jgi:hypothetical protein
MTPTHWLPREWVYYHRRPPQDIQHGPQAQQICVFIIWQCILLSFNSTDLLLISSFIEIGLFIENQPLK